MTPPGTEIGEHGQLLVGPTGSGWEPPAGRELARAMLVGAGRAWPHRTDERADPHEHDNPPNIDARLQPEREHA
jgi:hypothetical protein